MQIQETEDVEYLCTLEVQGALAFLTEDVLHWITNIRHPCSFENVACNDCKIHAQLSWRLPEPECIAFLQKRQGYMQYLRHQIYRSVLRGAFQIWNKDLNEAKPHPIQPAEKEVSPERLEFWVKRSYILKSDLRTFCKSERINLVFTSSLETSRLETIEPNGQELAQCNNSAPSVKTIRLRQDALAAEYDPILRKDPSLTPTQLMALLLARIDAPGTCVLAHMGDGLSWEPYNGPPKTATLKNLEGRIARWRKKYGIATRTLPSP